MSVVHTRSDECGFAFDPASGDRIVVRAVRYDRNHPATGSDLEFYVERYRGGDVISAAGFETEQQAFEYISAYPEEKRYSVFGKDVLRTGLGVPDGLIMKSQYSLDSAKAQKQSDADRKQAVEAEEAQRKQELADMVTAQIANQANQRQAASTQVMPQPSAPAPVPPEPVNVFPTQQPAPASHSESVTSTGQTTPSDRVTNTGESTQSELTTDTGQAPTVLA